MAPSGGLWNSVAMTAVKNAFRSQSKLLKARISEATGRTIGHEVQPAFARSTRQAIHPLARLRQSKGKWYTTHAIKTIRRFLSTHTPRYDRSAFPKSATRTAVEAFTGRAPFASTLRPNLTGGALPRTAGGYCLGGGRIGGVRHFSHTPAAPAQVVQNVSQAFRAFALNGGKIQFDGVNSRGEKRYRTVSGVEKETTSKMLSVPKMAPGSYIDFHVNPTITALSPLSKGFPYQAQATGALESEDLTINTEGFLDILSVDFARAFKDLAAITNDLKALSRLGDLAITMENKSIIRVHFPGCDAESVENLCDELGIQRGIVHQDRDFDASVGGDIALKFPYAPTSDYAISSPAGSLRSQAGLEEEFSEAYENPWLESSPDEGFTELEHLSEIGSGSGEVYFGEGNHSNSFDSSEYLEGINRFLEFCDTARRI